MLLGKLNSTSIVRSKITYSVPCIDFVGAHTDVLRTLWPNSFSMFSRQCSPPSFSMDAKSCLGFNFRSISIWVVCSLGGSCSVNSLFNSIALLGSLSSGRLFWPVIISKANYCCFAEGVSGKIGFGYSSGRSSIICFIKSWVSNLCSSSSLRFPAIFSGRELSSWVASSIYCFVSDSYLSVNSIF